MKDMRTYGTGSFDHKARRWRVKTENIKATINQLRERYGQQVPDSEHGSQKFWLMYLADARKGIQDARKQASPYPLTLLGLERIIGLLQREGQDVSAWEKRIKEVLAIPESDTEAGNFIMWSPATLALAERHGTDKDDLLKMVNVEQDAHPSKPSKTGLTRAIEGYVKERRDAGDDHAGQIEKALTMLAESAVGNELHELDATGWMNLYRRLGQSIPGERTRYNYQQHIIRFLHRMEFNHGLNFTFLKNPDYKYAMPHGQKVTYTPEQVQLALREATGTARMMLMLGLNCGFTVGDVATLTNNHLMGGRIEKAREKNKHRKNPLHGSWLLWQETEAVLQYGMSKSKLGKAYSKFARKHGLPSHDALRKTIFNMIRSKFGLDVGQLYRAENCRGVAGKFYFVLGDADKFLLDTALAWVRDQIFDGSASIKLVG